MTPKERESYAEDLEARRGVSPGDNIFSVSVVTYYRQRNHGTPSEEWREWCKVTRDVQRAASTLLGALEAVKASPLPRQHLLYANNYATGIAVSGDPEWALDGWYRAGECAAFLLGRDDGKALLASLRDLASDDHRPLHRLEQHEPETAEQVINLSEGEAPAGVNPLHWLCWQFFSALEAVGPKKYLHEDVLSLLRYYHIEEHGIYPEYNQDDMGLVLGRIRTRISRIRRKVEVHL